MKSVVVDRRQELRDKYLNLGTGELAAAVAFALAAVVFVIPRLGEPGDRAALLSALLPLLVVLAQAGTYWLLARTWVEKASMPVPVAGLYRAFRVPDAALLGAALIGVLMWWPERPGTVLLVVAVWVFGVVEYINYFLIRLAYPVDR